VAAQLTRGQRVPDVFFFDGPGSAKSRSLAVPRFGMPTLVGSEKNKNRSLAAIRLVTPTLVGSVLSLWFR
jgi:hypothetical protein